jgi:hypothetical protein
MKNSQKGGAKLLLVIALILVVAGIYFYSILPKEKMEVVTDEKDVSMAIGEEDLLIIKATGGLCPYGPCFRNITIKGNGEYVDENGPDKKSGKLSVGQISKLTDMIDDADFKSIRSEEFAGTCPTAYDGSRFVYMFQTGDGLETVDSCVTQIDPELPLFKEIGSILVGMK